MKMSHFAARSDGVQHSEEARQDLGSLQDTASQVSSLTSSNRSPKAGKKRKRQEGEGEEASPPMSLSGLSGREHRTPCLGLYLFMISACKRMIVILMNLRIKLFILSFTFL